MLPRFFLLGSLLLSFQGIAHSRVVMRIPFTLAHPDGSFETIAMEVSKGEDLLASAGKFLETVSIIPKDLAAFWEEVRKEVMVRGSIVQWKVAIIVVSDVRDLFDEVELTGHFFTEADKVVFVTNGFSLSQEEVDRLFINLKEIFRGEATVQHTTSTMTPELAFDAAWHHIPPGAIISLCISTCKLPRQATYGPFRVLSDGRIFLQYVRMLWSFSGSFKGPFVTVASGSNLEQPTKGKPKHMVILFDTSTVHYLGHPSASEGNFETWLGIAKSQRVLYIFGQRPIEFLEYSDVHARRGVGMESSVTSCQQHKNVVQEQTSSDLHSSMGRLSQQRPCFTMLCPSFVVLVVLQGDGDRTTGPIFQDIAETIDHGLTSLKLPSRIVYCHNLPTDECFTNSDIVIVLAAHNLVSFVTREGKMAALSHNLLPADTVIYNFEHVPHQIMQGEPSQHNQMGSRNQHGSLVTEELIKIYSMGYPVWDYSEENVKNLLGMDIKAHLVPLGYSPTLRFAPITSSESCTGSGKQIDVLFMGSPTPYRTQAIRRLRAAGLQVVHPNSGAYTAFGLELESLLSDTKIVLNLSAFDQDGEWKMTRLARLLANERFVISEEGGTQGERDSFRAGVIFVAPEHIAETCMYFLKHHKERCAIAKRGREIFEQQNEGTILQGPIEELLYSKMTVGTLKDYN